MWHVFHALWCEAAVAGSLWQDSAWQWKNTVLSFLKPLPSFFFFFVCHGIKIELGWWNGDPSSTNTPATDAKTLGGCHLHVWGFYSVRKAWSFLKALKANPVVLTTLCDFLELRKCQPWSQACEVFLKDEFCFVLKQQTCVILHLFLFVFCLGTVMAEAWTILSDSC